MIKTTLSIYYLFIDHWKHFSKLFEFFVKITGTGTSFEVLGVLSDWIQHRLCSFKTICNVFYIRYLSCSAFLMKSSWTIGTQNLITVTAVVSSWIGTGVISAIKSISFKHSYCINWIYNWNFDGWVFFSFLHMLRRIRLPVVCIIIWFIWGSCEYGINCAINNLRVFREDMKGW